MKLISENTLNFDIPTLWDVVVSKLLHPLNSSMLPLNHKNINPLYVGTYSLQFMTQCYRNRNFEMSETI